ncbi:MAG: alpha-glucan family phosphorylase [Caldilineaceae bacterium]
MNILGHIAVFPKLPAAIARLHDLAFNLWWSWNPAAQSLFSSLDEELWRAVNQNPVKFLRSASQELLDQATEDQAWLTRFAAVMDDFDAYMHPQANTWYRRTHGESEPATIAYFSAEFGLHEALPIYSGGLGVLSGDHCKEASDLGLPFVGVGFLYPQGYFTQRIPANGQQEAIYEKIDFSEVPATPALDPSGKPVLIHVDLPGRTVYAKVWRIQVGRIPLYLMDTDVERNAPQDRELSARLYGGDNEMRISQEFMLGIGGVRLLRALGLNPSVWHMNEGHSAFLNLERIRELVEQGIPFDTGVETVRAGSIFTTHTPVPAGHDAFAFELMEKFFWQFWGRLGIDRERFLDLARHEQSWGPQFSMTVLAFRLSAYHNGVSELHGHVSREMWKEMWPGTPVEQVPITHITNGVHTGTWLADELRDLYNRYLQSDWLEEVDDPATWEGLASVPDAELWAVHNQRKAKMVDFVRDRVSRQFVRHGEGPRRLAQAHRLLDPNALTLGFARRFATYKRATLIFRDMERLKRLLTDPERPVQIVFAGKAHPKDEPGKALIQRIYEVSQDPELIGKIVFVENYDMNVARHLIAGVDVWLNTPRRPYEASGTSGQKAALSGAPNFSILDGWWREGYDGTNGWAIGEEREYKDTETQDEADALSFYATMEDVIVPLFYDRGADGIPGGWLTPMRRSIVTCGPGFSMRRMVKEYTERLYLPALGTGRAASANEYAEARALAEWKRHVRDSWFSVNLQSVEGVPSQAQVGDALTLSARLWPGRLSADDLAVEIVVGSDGGSDFTDAPTVIPMQAGERHGDGSLDFVGDLSPRESGRLAVGIRVRPQHPGMVHPHETGLARWV